MTTATAHPNIALVKYWGKQDVAENLPATANLSITLSELVTTTTVEDAAEDQLIINGAAAADAKINAFLGTLRERFTLPPLRISTQNNFPTGAGLASSASGFAALVTAINAHAGLGLDTAAMSDWARRGSASAARSMYAGFVALAPPDWRASQVAEPQHWPLHTVVAVTSTAAKSVSSTEGMNRSRLTSPFYQQWVQSSNADFQAGLEAIQQRDFAALSRVAELSCLKMHSVMLTSTPTLSYWNPATVACMDRIRKLRADGIEVFFTIDAGPQVKAICPPQFTAEVETALSGVNGVARTFSCAMGDGARVLAV